MILIWDSILLLAGINHLVFGFISNANKANCSADVQEPTVTQSFVLQNFANSSSNFLTVGPLINDFSFQVLANTLEGFFNFF